MTKYEIITEMGYIILNVTVPTVRHLNFNIERLLPLASSINLDTSRKLESSLLIPVAGAI
ncbi:MAG TPA: hypothetical protein VE504_07920 [Nitrososphaeraceae archaeon]|nr:hypothetical protein [Nitrososphaeraceae archaeon]